METLCTVTHEPLDGSADVFDFVVGRASAGWVHHRFDCSGRYESVGPCHVEDIAGAMVVDAPAEFIVEMRCAAVALETAVSGLLAAAGRAARDGDLDVADVLARRASEVQRERLRALDEVMAVCESAWDDAVDRVEHARGEDPDSLPSALRTVEMLWSARAAVRRLITSGPPDLP
jgi:hypothetical protein